MKFKKVSGKKVFAIKMYAFLMNKNIATYKTGNNLFCLLLFEFLICRYSVKKYSTDDSIDEMSVMINILPNVIQCVVFSRITKMKLHSK